MKTLDKILIPIDINIANEEVIDTATLLAKNFNSEIVLMTVLPKEALIKSIEKSFNDFAIFMIRREIK